MVLASCGARASLLDAPFGPDEGTGTGASESMAGSPSGSESASPSAAEPPSCVVKTAGTDDCNGESCCASLEVPGGTYFRGYVNHGTGPIEETDPAVVSGFRLDKYLVTVGRFRQYVNYLTKAGGTPPSDGSGKHVHLNGGNGLVNSGTTGGYETGWNAAWNTNLVTGSGTAGTWNDNLGTCAAYSSWTPSASSHETLPVDCVTWYEAYAFCIWDGGFLPSEAEAEYAGAGGDEQRQYPWGSTDPGTANQYAIYGCYYPNNTEEGLCAGSSNLAPVGTAKAGVGRWGQLDLAGEVAYWNLDVLAAKYLDPCVDCARLDYPMARTLRGGGFTLSASTQYPWLRGADSMSDRGLNGIRCAWTP
ncbi:MAG: formylglycine-generating enzyme family protein [Polyangiaceae bacterium]|nr:formylglycine-generating enzyme family protein [Polyangiaceae bacterium]